MQGTELKFSSALVGMQLCSKVRILKSNPLGLRRSSAKALWDTGASISAISRRLASALGLGVRARTRLATAVGDTTTFNDVVVIDLFFDDMVLPVIVAVVDSIPGDGNDFLIGMDIIQCGDLAISTDHKTCQFNVKFNPYPNLFKPLKTIFPNLPPGCIEDF